MSSASTSLIQIVAAIFGTASAPLSPSDGSVRGDDDLRPRARQPRRRTRRREAEALDEREELRALDGLGVVRDVERRLDDARPHAQDTCRARQFLDERAPRGLRREVVEGESLGRNPQPRLTAGGEEVEAVRPYLVQDF